MFFTNSKTNQKMKKSILTFALAISCAFIAQAQTEKGTLLLGGNAGFSSTSVAGASSSNYNLSPNVGYFISENFALGGRVGFNGGSGFGGGSFSSYQIAPFGRYYFLPIGSNAKLFGDASIGIGGASGGGGNTTIFGLAAGPAVFLNKNTALEITAGLQSANTGGVSQTTFGLNVGFQIHFAK